MTEKGTYIVAGGSSGIGSELVVLLTNKGFSVVNLDVNVPETELSSLCVTKQVDLTDPKSLESIVLEVSEEYEEIKGVAVVAGIGFTTPLKDLDPYEFSRQVNLNLNLVYNVCYYMISKLRTPASIVTVSSTSVYGFAGSSVAYAAAKSGVIGLTKSLAHEIGKRGIRVNCVVPGGVDTGLLNSLSTSMERSLMSKFTPLGGLAHPRQIAETIDFLLDERSNHITGQTIVVDGGLSLAYRPSHM